MFERFITDWYFNLINLSEHVNRAIFRRLFLPCSPAHRFAASRLRYSLLRCFACPILRHLFTSIHDVREIGSIMYERLDWLCFRYLLRISISITYLSEHLCIPPSILTLRDFVACFAGSFLRRLRPVTFFSVLFVGAYYPYLLSSQFYR